MSNAIDIGKKYGRFLNGYMPLEQARRAGVVLGGPLVAARMSVAQALEIPPDVEQLSPSAAETDDTIAQKEEIAPLVGGRAVFGATGL
jgi:hypothetical protein